MKTNLGFSAIAIQKMISSPNWVETYREELKSRVADLKVDSFEKDLFISALKEKLYKALESELSTDEYFVRNSIAEWMQISHLKAFSMFNAIPRILNQLTKTVEIYEQYLDVPIGPQEKTIVKKMDQETVAKWRSGSLMAFYSEASINNVLGTYVSEVFFTTEAMLRIICMGSCVEFAIKTILPNQIIQHDFIHKTLKRLGNESSEKVNCRLCSMNDTCKRKNDFLVIASIYEVFYHLRAIKDYKRAFYFNDNLSEFLISDFIPTGLNVVFSLDEIINNIYSNYLYFPYSLEETYKTVKNSQK